MPVKINYQNTVIYQILHAASQVVVYVSHTTNFTQKKYKHKLACEDHANCSKLYQIIRSYGGWNYVKMIEIERYPCNYSEDAVARELYHKQRLQPLIEDLDGNPYITGVASVLAAPAPAPSSALASVPCAAPNYDACRGHASMRLAGPSSAVNVCDYSKTMLSCSKCKRKYQHHSSFYRHSSFYLTQV